MTTCTITERSGITWLTIRGRIDGMTSPDVKRSIDELISGGKRFFIVNLEQVNFVSSAGLRVFLGAQNQLQNVGGEMILFKISDVVLQVFKTSGFDKIFRILATEEELAAASAVSADALEVTTRTDEGITFKHREMAGAAMGTLRIIGNQDKLASADYTRDDVVTVSQADLQFGTGLATVGEQYEEYRYLFGEALIINRNFYFYPAVKRPAVDFMLYSGKDAGTECRYLHGFGFDGRYRYVASFEIDKHFITLDRLVQWVLSLPSAASLLGIILLAESKGVLGMNLKQVPLRENKPAQGSDILNPAQFASWINFPVDPVDENNIVAGAGIICRDRGMCSARVRKLFSSESNIHLHAGIFEKGPISKIVDQFSDELDRVLNNLDILKVQHLLGQSRFSNGMLGIIELKG
jgi:anti-anti-sigma factor